MEHNMILSASGWRKIFAESGNERDTTTKIGRTNEILSILIGKTFASYIQDKLGKKELKIAVARDTRPTGEIISDCLITALEEEGIKVLYVGIASAPEIMAYAKKCDGFVYVSASHNPVGHNGIKFGLSDGGVLEGTEAKKVIDSFKKMTAEIQDENSFAAKPGHYEADSEQKTKSLENYSSFIRHVISGSEESSKQESIFSHIKNCARENKIAIVCDMNGSARCLSIDKSFIPETGLELLAFNDTAGNIVHEIIPEPENLVHCAREMARLQKEGRKDAILGYMPDCDGDRGNIVYWDEKTGEAKPIAAQEVFALCVLAELSFEKWKGNTGKTAVAVNCPTSMRIDEIAKAFSASLFRAEVGEANVVNLAREKRSEGYSVRILGEGSNGGNITYPSSVRDPIASVYALVKLLVIRDQKDSEGNTRKGLFHLWCTLSGQENKYRNDFTLSDIMETLPQYTTTGVSENRAVLKVKSSDKGILKENFKAVFESEWNKKKDWIRTMIPVSSWVCITTNGTRETENPASWNNQNGGLKIKFLDEKNNALAFIWMRPSGTEPVFRVMCDVKGSNAECEKKLLQWETEMILRSDAS
ncbi:MAG: phosphoglucomutase [Treponema sp.]|nr:phosphoglucomutase [Treponema sp.]